MKACIKILDSFILIIIKLWLTFNLNNGFGAPILNPWQTLYIHSYIHLHTYRKILLTKASN